MRTRKVESAPSSVHLLSAGLFLLALLLATDPLAGTAQPTRAALEPFTGHWKGPFVIYTYAGRQVDSLVAEHRYQWEGSVQVGRQVDRYPDGRVVRHTTRNYVKGNALICEVTQSDGDTTVYRGRVVGKAIVWHRRTEEGVVESFRERVVQTPEGREYRIDGFGVYPDGDGTASYLQFKGRYQAVSNGRE